MNNNPSAFPKNVSLAASLIVIFLIIIGAYYLKPVLVPFIFALLFSIAVSPLFEFFRKRKIPKVIAIVFTLLITLSILALFLFFAARQLSSFQSLMPKIMEDLDLINSKFQNFIITNFNIDEKDLSNELQNSTGDIVKSGTGIISETLAITTSLIGSFVIVPLYSFFLLLYADRIKNFFYKLFEKKSAKEKVDEVLNRVIKVVQSYISGVSLVILIIATLNSSLLLLIGIDNAIFFGVFAACLILIPYVGVYFGAIWPILMALLTKDSPVYALYVMLAFVFTQFLEGNFITPYIVGSKVSINPLVSILALLLFGSLWGLSGMVLAMPLTAITKVIFEQVDSLKPWAYLMGDEESNKLSKSSK